MGKKKSKKKYESILDKRFDFDIQDLMDNSNSYKSLIYGIVTVIVLFIVLALGIRTLSQNKAEIDDGAVMTQKFEESIRDKRYTVVEGETLWAIAEKEYGDGFKWHEIAEANNISDPSKLEKGAKILIPKIASADKGQSITSTPTPTKEPQDAQLQDPIKEKITSDSYIIVRGDYLWEIAVRAYGDGYRWVDIARANNLSNPDLIFSGNKLILPRP